MKSIKDHHSSYSLKNLIDALEKKQFEDVLKNFDQIEISEKELEPYMFWDNECYTRNCISHSDSYELLVLCWKAGQSTSIHGHNNQECFVKVVKGSFLEVQYNWDEKSNSMIEIGRKVLSKNDDTSIDKEAIYHSLTSMDNEKTISIHLYVGPINQCEVFKDESITIKELSYFSKAGTLV